MTRRPSPTEQDALFAQARQRAARHRQVLRRAWRLRLHRWLRLTPPPPHPQPEAC